MAALLLQTLRRRRPYYFEMRMPLITTEIVSTRLNLRLSLQLLSRLGTFLRGILLSIEKPVKTRTDKLLAKKKSRENVAWGDQNFADNRSRPLDDFVQMAACD